MKEGALGALLILASRCGVFGVLLSLLSVQMAFQNARVTGVRKKCDIIATG
jgi:hypothetical protein